MEARTSSDDTNSSKPDPDIVEAALKRIGLKADTMLLLGDTPYDVEAARIKHEQDLAEALAEKAKGTLREL